MTIEKSLFGETDTGKPVHLFSCKNRNGVVMKLIDYGAIMTSFETPDRDGETGNITLGFPSLGGYLKRHPYFGSTVGRVCNRISHARFELDGKVYELAANDGLHHLHGGWVGFDKVHWDAEEVQTPDSVGIRFQYLSPDGEEGYPGNLDVSAWYILTNNNELRIEFAATTDKPTPVNLTNHNYWNLAGADSGSILEHELLIAADIYLPADEEIKPTGELAPVQGTPLDFNVSTLVGARIKEIESDPVGYDHCYVVRGGGEELALAARLKDASSGRVMEVHTTQPGIQFYTGNFLDGTPESGNYSQYSGLCLETQYFPNSPNEPRFPSVVLSPGERFEATTVHKFSTE